MSGTLPLDRAMTIFTLTGMESFRSPLMPDSNSTRPSAQVVPQVRQPYAGH